MKLETVFYAHGEQAGYVGWVTTQAGTYFIDKEGLLTELYPKEEAVIDVGDTVYLKSDLHYRQPMTVTEIQDDSCSCLFMNDDGMQSVGLMGIDDFMIPVKVLKKLE